MVSERCLQVPFNAFFIFGFACWIALEKYIYKRISLRSGNSLEYGIQGSANIFSSNLNFPKTTMVSERCLQVPFNAFFIFGFACCIALEMYIIKRISLLSGNSLEYGIHGSSNILSANFNFPKTTFLYETFLILPFNAFFIFGFACWIALEMYIYKRISLRSGNSLEYGIQGSANILSAYFNFPKTTMVSERCLQVPFNAFLVRKITCLNSSDNYISYRILRLN